MPQPRLPQRPRPEPARRRSGAEKVLAVFNRVVVVTTAAYLTTGSVVVTLTTVLLAAALVAWLALLDS